MQTSWHLVKRHSLLSTHSYWLLLHALTVKYKGHHDKRRDFRWDRPREPVLVGESVVFAKKTLTRSKTIPPATQAIQNISQVPHDRMNVNTTHR